MIKKLVYKILKRRHYWRYVGFDELSELCTSAMLRSTSLSLIGIFVPIYLYKLDYGLPMVMAFMAALFAARILSDVLSGFLVAWFGPKHIILTSYLLQILSLVVLLELPDYNWLFWPAAIIYGLANSLFFVAYHVDFSKIMHSDHGGKELGLMTILERIGAAIGPVAGGVVATMFGAEYTLVAAIVLLTAAAIPMLMSAEPVRLKQKLHFKGLPIRSLWRDNLSYGGLGYSTTVSIGLWPIFMAIAIFANNDYAFVGLVVSVGTIAAILSARAIGHLVDRRKGRVLLRSAVNGILVINMTRPFVGSFGGAALINIAESAVISGYKLPYTKGMYDRADSLPGYRVAYLVMVEVFGDLGKLAAWLVAFGVSLALPDVLALQVCFVLGALVSLLIKTERFPAI